MCATRRLFGYDLEDTAAADTVVTADQQEAAAAIVRAIRRVYGSPDGIGGVEKFTVHNVHDFARRLLEQGVSVREPQ